MKNPFNQASKPKVLVCVLTGAERQQWINPDLAMSLWNMARDSRFQVEAATIKDAFPVEVARNEALVAARDYGFDWCVQMDNDNFPNCNLLDIIAAAGPAQHVIGLTYAIGAPHSEYRLLPPPSPNSSNSPFREVECLNGGMMMVHRTVWEKIPRGPWFRWVHDEGAETLRDNSNGPLGHRSTTGRSEDFYFVDLCRQRGLKVWTHTRVLAGHYRTADITGMVCTLSQMRRPA